MLRRMLARTARRHQVACVTKTEHVLKDSSLTLLDVGAADGAPPRWSPYASLIHYVAVEPDSRSAQTVATTKTGGYLSSAVVPSGLWSESRAIDLNLCRKPQVSSVYEPNTDFLLNFPNPERFDIVDSKSMNVTTIDAVTTERNISFDGLKIDVQGAEREVLRGAEKALDQVLLVEAEVEFIPLYKNQPLFGAVSEILAEREFEFVDFLAMYRWHPHHLDGTGQLVFADALFMRTPESLKSEISITQRRYAALSMIYQRGEMLSRLARVVEDPALVREFEDLALFVSNHTSRSQRLLNIAGRVARIRDHALQAHLLH